MKYYTDGYLRVSNPSPIGGGYTIIDENNVLIERTEIRKSPFTNNEAEILGLLNAMKHASIEDEISTDSMCCISWVFRGISKSRPDLHNLLQECSQLRKQKELNIIWEGRDFNLAGIYNEEHHDER